MDVHLEPWSESALGLLRSINTPQMRHHVGGPESEEQLLARHRRYLALPETGRGCMFAVLLGAEPVGSIAYHRRDWQGRRSTRPAGTSSRPTRAGASPPLPAPP